MKNAILGLALVSFAFGCKSNKNAAVSDPAAANMPKAECSMNKEGCTAGAKAECANKKACCQEKAEAPKN